MARRITSARSPIKSILSHLPGGWHTAFVLLREAAAKDSESEESKLMAAYEELVAVNARATLEEIAERAEMSHRRLLEVVVGVAYERGVRVSKLIAALNLEKIMERGVREAAKANGFKDRENILQAAGLYPAPPGTQINVDMRQLAEQGVVARGIAAADELDEFERDTLESTSFLRGVDSPDPKRLGSPAAFVDIASEPAP